MAGREHEPLLHEEVDTHTTTATVDAPDTAWAVDTRADRFDDRGSIRGWAAGLGVVTLAGAGIVGVGVFTDALNMPDWFAGGKSDPNPRGTVIYEDQKARASYDEIIMKLGPGEATMSMKAKRNWDKPGTWGDYQPTNGTSHVRDPEDGDQPATLTLDTEYCSNGTLSVTEDNPDTPENDSRVVFDMNEMFVCHVEFDVEREENAAAIKQDDTPNDFHGEFVSFVVGAAKTTVEAAECPTDELERYTSDRYLLYRKAELAERYGVPLENVEVIPAEVRISDQDTQEDLKERLEGYANVKDPENSDKTYEGLSIQYFDGEGAAVEDSCYFEPSETPLADIESMPDPDFDTQTTTTTAGGSDSTSGVGRSESNQPAREEEQEQEPEAA